jgi:sugar phosphate isomerase/epimerase
MLSRRHFLGGISCGLATLAIRSRARGAARRAETLSLGYGLYGMKTTPLAEAIGQCATIGYRNLEFTLYPGYATEPAVFSTENRRAVRDQLKRLGLTVSCLKARPEVGAEPAARRRGEEQVAAAARLALDLANPALPLIAVHAGGRTAEWEKLRSFIADQVGAWTDTCTRLGVPIALKAHVGNAVDRPERLLWLLERIPALKIVYDQSHFSLLDLPLQESLDALRPHLAMIQVKDVRHTADGKHEFLLPGDGGVDYANYFRALDRIKFSGPVVVEVSAQLFNRPDYNPLVAAKRSYQVLSAALQARRNG